VDGIGLSIGVEGFVVSFEDFYRLEFARVYRAAWFLARNEHDAREAAQEAFARAFVRWRRLHSEDWAAGWVITTALNILRRRGGRGSRVELPLETTTSAPSGNAVDLQRALRDLPARQREALVLFYVGDLTVESVADLMGVGAGTVKAHLSRGRAALRKCLETRHA
jgi:RNA polymerase sigma-70 factor (ECF subfamily)